MSEVATYLKVGVTAIILGMVENEAISRTFTFQDPVRAMQQISHDITLKRPLELDDGTKIRATEVQQALHADALRFIEAEGTDAVGGEVALDVLQRWGDTLDTLNRDPLELASTLDWVAKYRLLDAYRDRHGLDWNDARLAAMDIQFHDMRPDRSLARKLGFERISTDAEVLAATTNPPEDTRAYFRGECLRKWGEHIVAANWDSLVFDVGVEPLRRIPMMEPTRGTRHHVGTVLEECSTPLELLDRLNG